MESNADSFIKGWDVEVGEGATPDWVVVEICVVGGAGADMDAEEGDGGTITIGRGVVDWDGRSCSCGCDWELLRETLIDVRWEVLAVCAGGGGGGG